MISSATSLAHFDTIYSADCIEWCHSAGYEDLFICGTYQVLDPASTTKQPNDQVDTTVEKDQHEDDVEVEDESESVKRQTQRTGRLLLFQVTDPQSAQSTLREVQRIESNAILDAKWCSRPSSGAPGLAVADAKGQFVFYELSSSRRLEHVQAIQVADTSTLCLSLALSAPQLEELVGDTEYLMQSRTKPSLRIAVSLSNGSLSVLACSIDGEWAVEQTWHAHDFEPWCVAWDPDTNYIWSGGDDCKLKKWDLRDTSVPVYVNRR